MTISILPGGFDQGSPDLGQQKAGLDESWIKALERAHFDKQRESMTSSSMGGHDAPSSNDSSDVREHGNKVNFAGEEISPKNIAPAHQTVKSSTISSPETTAEVFRPTNTDLKVLDRAAFQGASTSTTSSVKSARLQETSVPLDSFGTLQIERPAPRSVFPLLSVNILPNDSGVELVIRDQTGAGSQLTKAIKEVQAFLAENNQKLASIRVNGEVVSTFEATSDDDVSLTNQKPNKINRTY